jgi:hypothetical protein
MSINDVVDEETFKFAQENGWQNLSSGGQLMFFKQSSDKSILKGVLVRNTKGYNVESYCAVIDGSKVKCFDAHLTDKNAVMDYIKESLIMYG